MKKKTIKQVNQKRITGKWVGGLIAVALISLGGLMAMQQSTNAEEVDIIVYKSPSCGCCKDWVKHLKENGFTVEVHDQDDVSSVKRELGVPRNLQSCHTAKVDGYVIEGHVPADLIAKIRKERPRIKGLAVPGMPMGSPGMEGPRKDPYDVVTFNEKGKTSVYASR